MADQQRYGETHESQSQSKAKTRAPEQPAKRPAQRTAEQPAPPEIVTADLPASTIDAQKSASIKAGEVTATAGLGGERNLAIQWIDVWVGNHKPCRFDVLTSPGHELEVIVEQAVYKRAYNANGTISTRPVPVAPVGTKIKVTARDMTTSEVLEQTGVWYNMGGGGLFGGLWEAIKRLLWQSDAPS